MTDIPAFDCKPGCHDCCGVVPFSDSEKRAAQARFPLVAWKKFGADSWLASGALKTFSCPFVGNGGCSIYAIRPTVCRLFGAVDNELMRCPHGCGPDALLSEAQSRAALAAA
jgi:uncharacterized protein